MARHCEWVSKRWGAIYWRITVSFCSLSFFPGGNRALTYWFLWNCRFGGRLISIKENNKFRAVGNVTENGVPTSLKDFVSEIKSTFGLKSGSFTFRFFFFLTYMSCLYIKLKCFWEFSSRKTLNTSIQTNPIYITKLYTSKYLQTVDLRKIIIPHQT